MDHAQLRELAAGAALDDLEPGEAADLRQHLETCGACRALTRDLDMVVGELGLAAPPMRPPADLHRQVLGAIRADRRPVLALATTAHAVGTAAAPPARPMVMAPGSTDGSSGRTASRDAVLRWAGLAAAAVFAIAAVGLGVQNQQLNRDVAVTNQALVEARTQLETRQTAVTVAADPGHVTVALHPEPIAPSATAVVMYRPGTTEAVLMATDLPATPAGHVYQLWFADTSGVHPLGTYQFDGVGPFVAPFGVDLGGSAAAMVTLEPIGGAVGEPGPQVVFGEL
jgi:Anti-sigma-K factor rskA, C-terminal